MKKAIMSLCLAAALVFGAAGVQAADQDKGNNPVLQFTGSVWQKSSLDNKLSFLFGMDTAIATEYFVNSREAELAAKNGKMPVSNLSKFEKGWMKAFKDVKRTTIVEEVDAGMRLTLTDWTVLSWVCCGLNSSSRVLRPLNNGSSLTN